MVNKINLSGFQNLSNALKKATVTFRKFSKLTVSTNPENDAHEKPVKP